MKYMILDNGDDCWTYSTGGDCGPDEPVRFESLDEAEKELNEFLAERPDLDPDDFRIEET